MGYNPRSSHWNQIASSIRLLPTACQRGKVSSKPFRSDLRGFFQRAGFLEKMRGARNNPELLFAVQSAQGLFIERNHLLIVSADDEQRRRGDPFQRGTRQIGPAAARNDGTNAGA